MHKRHAYRPTAWDMLEERMVPSRGNSFLDPFGLSHLLMSLVHADRQEARPVVTVGALGDSYTDEYRFYPPDQSQARNWVEILSATRRVDFGPFTTKSRGEPRDQGFAFNWARNGATSNDMIRNQLPGLVSQVAKGQVKYAWIFVGGNDFIYFLRNVAAGKIAPDQALPTLNEVESQAETNFKTAVNTLLAANPKVKLVVATVPDVSLLPQVRAELGNNPLAQVLVNAVSQATQKYNAAITATAAGNNRIALADLAGTAAQLAQSGASGSISFGGTTIDLTTSGDGYHHFFLADGVHAGTVIQGVIAEAFISTVDAKFRAKIQPLAPRQIVQFASHIRPQIP